MIHVCSVVGARPQFVKTAVVSRALRDAGMNEVLVHTGQHYDTTMDRVFFDELDIPAPIINLGVGSASQAAQTGSMMEKLEKFLRTLSPKPDWIVVYGDTNSTLAGALVAAKEQVPLAHVEAGLRSFNRQMPEEVNRVVTDHLSSVLFCPTMQAVENLNNEGIRTGVELVGDVMFEATLIHAERAVSVAPLDMIISHEPRQYYIATVHRAENTDARSRLQAIFDAFGDLLLPVILPLHPRTRKQLRDFVVPSNVELLEPLGYAAMLTLVRLARGVLTDSGGLQKEAVWLGTPCVTLREETEWTETLVGGFNRLAGADYRRIMQAVSELPPCGEPPEPAVRGQGKATYQIVERLRGST